MARDDAERSRSREDRMDFRLLSEHKSLIERAAAYSGESLTGFAISTLVREARRIVQEYEAVILTTRDRDRFLSLLDSPPAPNEELRRAVEHHGDHVVRTD